MTPNNLSDRSVRGDAARDTAGRGTVFPLAFLSAQRSRAAEVYLNDPLIRQLAAFFERKGLATLKEEDQREQWYEDWLAYQAEHVLYARLLSPKQFSSVGAEFDLLRYTRFLEVFGYFSPAHGYSLQVTFLGLFAILMGSNTALKQEAVAALEAGGLFALGVSEKGHGSDLLGNEFTVVDAGEGRLAANGSKYYIGNANAAAMISILAKRESARADGKARRAPFLLFALRPGDSKGFGGLRKIRTLGVRSAFVGEFAVKNHDVAAGDLIAEGRNAWDAVFGTVTLGKFFLAFGSIGLCERALEEAVAHLSTRMLYGRPVIEMPHIRSAMSQAYARLAAMKMFAFRALDYVHAASATDRRYLLFTAVQKARVSTEGVRVMALLSECVGAKGFEADTYFEMALRDVQLFPSLEGSRHINLGLTAQFIPKYFSDGDGDLAEPGSLVGGEVQSAENPYLYEARTGAVNTVGFAPCLNAFAPFKALPNVGIFEEQVSRFQRVAQHADMIRVSEADTPVNLAMGECLATIAYAQLIAESAARLAVPEQVLSVIFHLLVNDFSVSALTLASLPAMREIEGVSPVLLVSIPKTTAADWDSVCAHMSSGGVADPGG